LLILRAVVWGLAGALFGTLAAGLFGVSLHLHLPPGVALVLATAGAGAVTAAFYAAMQVALAGTLAGALASIATLILYAHSERLLPLLLIAGLAGALAGAAYNAFAPLPRRPMAHALSGLTAGLLTGLVLQLLPSLPPIWLAGLAAAGVGAGYQLLTTPLLSSCRRLVPTRFSAPLVAALIASVVAASIWLIGGTTAGTLPPDRVAAIGEMLQRLPSGLLGGTLGGALTGALLELFGVAWQAEAD
jgi:hypothetical protein